ncbi:MAG: CoA-transferase [Armatimonadetes bacterium]|nr:CoA-transferase [Armatimonadota bacterium]
MSAEAPFTLRELMVAAAAREINDGEVVFVGMRLPLLAFAVATQLHAPGAVGLFENGIIRDTPPMAPILTMGDAPNIAGAISCTGMLDVMGLLQQGRVDLGFLGGAEIDRFGNLNTTWVEDGARSTRLTGSGGAADIAALARRVVIIMQHERRRFRERVSYVTSPGYGDGAGWRRRVGLRESGPSRVITTLGVLGFDERTREMVLVSVHPGISVEEVRRETGWPLAVSPEVGETALPREEELRVIRRYDPEGIWTR